MKKFLPIVAITAFFVYSCTPKTTPVAEGSQKSASEKLAEGKTIYDNSCGKCHELPAPTAYTSEAWVGIMNSMAPKAKLTEEQHKLVYDYVVSVKK